MALKHHRWVADEDETRAVEVPVKSAFSNTDISAAFLEIEGLPDEPLNVGVGDKGYKLTSTGVDMPPAGVYAFRVRATEVVSGETVTVAKGELHVAEAI